MTTPPQPTPIAPCGKPECACQRPGVVVVDAERLRKLGEGLRRNADAVQRTIDRILAECEDGERAA